MGGLLRRQLGMAAGVAVWLVALFIVLSLASWNAADPSLSHATDSAVSNWMGFAGASVSDLLIQFFGLAALALLLPMFFLGRALFAQLPFGPAGPRAGYWLGGAVASAGFVGLMPMPQGWPLPVGLGGVIGDVVLKIPGVFSGGFPAGFVALVAGVILAPLAVWLLMRACMVRSLSSEQVSDDSSFDSDDEEDGVGRLVSIGAVLHAVYLLRSRIKKLLPATTPASRTRGASVAPARAGSRREPGWDAPVSAYETDVNFDENFGDDNAFSADGAAPDVDWGVDAVPAPLIRTDNQARGVSPSASPAVPASNRVVGAVAQPKPSVRVQREAQPSLLSDGSFELPSLHILSEPKKLVKDESLSTDALEQNARLLEGVLDDFGVKGEIIAVQPGPVVTLYELEPAPGIKSSRVIGLAEDIARSMSAIAARVAVVPGRNAIGIELPNAKRDTVYLRELLSSQTYEKSKAKLALTLGKTINGEAVIADLAKMPHLLVAGTTGSGKSVAINTMILSLLYKLSPEECRLIMIDPKMLELSVYDGIPHLLTPVVTDPKKAVVALKWTVREMEQRYKSMSKLGVRNIDGYNARVKEAEKSGEELTRTVQTGFDRETGEAIYESEALDLQPMPYIVVIIDEMADLMMVAGKDIEGTVQRLAQMARAAGIHVVMATQRPSVDVITGTIKANFPTRISFQVTSKIDSRTILGEQGAEQLLGMGDMLYMAGGGRIQRVHGPFVDDGEVEDVVKHLKSQGVPQYLEAITEDDDDEDGAGGGGAGADPAGGMGDRDDPYDQAVAIVLRDRKASTSYIQRRLGIGYNRAASLIERMEDEGVIGPANHAGKREIMVPSEEERIAGM
ncbi:MAG: DNA translocase FtsK [Ahrensia sp.]